VDLRDLEAFVAVAEELHFGRAAARLHMAQPPLSARISQLEKELRLQLFQRSTRSVVLTDAGGRLLAPARRVLTQMIAMRDAAASIVAGEEGLVRAGFLGASSQRALSQLMNEVRRNHPGIELALQSQTYVDSAFDLLVSGDLDVAFVRTPITRPELSFRIVEVEQVLCALPEGHRLSGRDSIRLEDLMDDGFVSLPEIHSMLRATLHSMCQAAGFAPRIAQVAPDSATVLALVAAGAGVTITLSSMRPVQSVGIVYKPIDDTEPTHMFAALAWRTDNTAPALARVLEDSNTALPTPDLSLYGIDRSKFGVGH
jgi:DNA-binding transcriptional LysR family regulator